MIGTDASGGYRVARETNSRPAKHNVGNNRAAHGGPKPIYYPTYGEAALKLPTTAKSSCRSVQVRNAPP